MGLAENKIFVFYNKNKKIIIKKIKMSDETSKSQERLKDFKVPEIVQAAFEYDKQKLINISNRVKCKGCGIELKFNIESNTSNLVAHVRDTNPLKHKVYYESYLLLKGASPVNRKMEVLMHCNAF
jgi:hypothetical protein